MAEHRYPRPGTPGASAQAVYDARRFDELRRCHADLQRDAAWRAGVRARHPLVGRIIMAARRLPAPWSDPATDAWRVGAEGERAVGAVLERCRGLAVLHDRARPGSRANLDHIAVARSGVHVIETKAYDADVELFQQGWWGSTGLLVAGRDRSDLLADARDQAHLIEVALGARGVDRRSVPVRPVLCFVGAGWRLPAASAVAQGVAVTCLDGLARVVGRRGPLGPADIASVARKLEGTLPPR